MKIFYGKTDGSLSSDIFCVVGVFSDGSLSIPADHPQFQLCQSMAQAEKIKGGKALYLAPRLALVDFGQPSSLGCWRQIGGNLFRTFMSQEAVQLELGQLEAEAVRAVAYGFHLRAWRFDTYRTKPEHPMICKELHIVTPHSQLLESFLPQDQAVITSVHWGRQLVNEPGNIIYPASFVDRLRELQDLGIELEVLDEACMRKEGFGALLGVNQGSQQPPYLAILKWKGATDSLDKPVALVGKGVTFDSGGLSIKPSSGMETMKMDKAGAVVVCAVLRALALRKAPVNAIAVVALVENMPSGTAQRPGDIVRSLSGQTIEVLNTDAEGRLILADALWYTQKRFNPSVIVDVATLTGAIQVALGPVYAGLFSSCDTLSAQLLEAGKTTQELLWSMPLCKAYDKAIDSPFADMKNITSPGFGAGSSTAAQFLKRFVPKDLPWAHLDIASVDFLNQDTPLCPKGGSAFGVRLLDQWIRNYESPAC